MSDLPEVAIPSYQRADILLTHTLSYLLSQDYPSEKITIFVADEEEKLAYQKKIPETAYKEIVVGKKGLLNQRMLINKHYPEGSIICQMDDDVRGLKMLREGRTFIELVRHACWLLNTKGGGLYGVMPNSDGRKMSDDLTRHLTHILGSFFICKNDKDCVPNTEEKEDYERSILYYLKYKQIYRFKGAGVITSYMKTPGGLQQPGRKERIETGVNYFLETYPDYCKRREKAGTADLLLNWRAPAS